MKWWKGSGGGGGFDAFFCLTKDTVARESLEGIPLSAPRLYCAAAAAAAAAAGASLEYPFYIGFYPRFLSRVINAYTYKKNY